MRTIIRKIAVRSAMYFVFAGSVLFSSSYAVSFDCFNVRPPQKYLQGVKKVAVLDFDGQKGRALADFIIALLLEEKRGIHAVGGGLFTSSKEGKAYLQGMRTNVFEIIERSQLETILQEQNLSNTGLINEQQAAAIGKILGIDAIITGTISYSSVDQDDTRKYTDNKGNVHYKYCTKRTVTAKARMKIISVTTAQIIGTADNSADNSMERCDEERTGLLDPGDMADNCCKEIASVFTDYFCPGFQQVRCDFKRIKNKEFKDQGREAESFIKDGDIDRAFAIYKAIYDKDPYCIEVVHAIMNLYDIAGDYAQAKKYGAMLAQLDPKEYGTLDKYYDKAIALTEMLGQFGVTVTPYEFKKGGNDALAEKIRTAGKRADRYEVKKSPDAGAETLTKVPGDMEFVVVEKKKGWYGIKLLDGSVGYISAANVD